jgi:hypothetical protein
MPQRQLLGISAMLHLWLGGDEEPTRLARVMTAIGAKRKTAFVKSFGRRRE